MRLLAWILAALLLVAGGLWTLDGLGIVGDDAENGTRAFLGPLMAGFGLALVIVLLQNRRR